MMNNNTRKERHKKDGPNSHMLEDRPNLLLSYSNLKVSFKTKNTIVKLLAQNKNINPNKLNKCGIYQFTCHDCNRKYTGQTGRPFHIRSHEHFYDFKRGNGKSKFALHLLDNKHSYGPRGDIMEILHVTRKGSKMNTVERFNIHNETKLDNQINDKCMVKYNVIFDTIIHKNS